MMKRLLLPLILSACIGIAPARAQERPGPKELDNMPAETRDEMVRKDLLSRLMPGSMVLGLGREGADVLVNGRAYATEFTGLCQRDVLTVHYSAVPGSAATIFDDLRVEPVGFSAKKQYRVVDAKVNIADANGRRALDRPLEGVCNQRVDSRGPGWFLAKDAETAAWGFNALAAAAGALRAGPSAKLGCGDEECQLAVLAAANGEALGIVEKCEAAWRNLCFKILDFSREPMTLTIEAALGEDRGSMTVTRVSAYREPDPEEIT